MMSGVGGIPRPLLHRKALTRYQMLFRHMFYCKHVERQLCSVWISNKAAKQHALHSAKWCVLCPHGEAVLGCTPMQCRAIADHQVPRCTGPVPQLPAQTCGPATTPCLGGSPQRTVSLLPGWGPLWFSTPPI